MDNHKNFLLAMILAAGVLLLQMYLFPPKPVPPAARQATASVPARVAQPAAAAVAALPNARAQIVTVRSPLYEYRFSTRGAALVRADLLRYPSYVQRGRSVQLVPEGARDVLANRVVLRDGRVLDLRNAIFTPSATRLDLGAGGQPRALTFRAALPGGLTAEVTYTLRADRYLVGVRGRITGTGGATLLTELGTGLANHDAAEHGSAQELAVVGWDGSGIDTRPLRKVGSADTIVGPLGWAAVKDRYFVLALLAEGGTRLDRILLRDVPDYRTVQVSGGKREPATLPRAAATAVSTLGPGGEFAFDAYVGPQERSRLLAAGHDLAEVNPYGYRWLRPVVRPIAAFILQVLNWAHGQLGIGYGWLLILAGFTMRAITWPLNSKAMRAQMRNMEKQPILQARMKEVQAAHKDDPARMQKEMMEVYREVGMSPFSMFSGCLPMLIPIPVLITLFFVFQSAIEFRGTRFWWLPDLSLADPLYILPVFLVLSMFALQYVSTQMSGMEQNPQTRSMMYIMPLVMGVLFFNFPSGLNLYYASTNLASLPQQLLISRERRRAADAKKPPPSTAAKPSTRHRGGGGQASPRRVKRRG